MKTCKFCGVLFPVTLMQGRKEYCSKSCNNKDWRQKQGGWKAQDIPCEGCGKTIFANNSRRRFCSNKCRHIVKYGHKKGRLPHLNSTAVGAIHELIVCADLLSRGYEVFKAFHAGSPCDLAILGNDKLYKVEVRTGYRDPDRNLLDVSGRQHCGDITAIVYEGTKIYYDPPIEDRVIASNNRSRSGKRMKRIFLP